MSSSLFITKTYTETAYIAKNKDKGIPAALRFTFRPCVPEERASAIEKINACGSASRSERMLCRILLEHIKEWDAGVPVDLEHLVIIRPAVLAMLASIIVFGTSSGNDDPEAPESTNDDLNARSELEQVPYSDLKVEENLKN